MRPFTHHINIDGTLAMMRKKGEEYLNRWQSSEEDFGYPDNDGVFRRKSMKDSRRMAEDGHGDW